MFPTSLHFTAQALRVTSALWAQQAAVWQVLTEASLRQGQAFMGVGPVVLDYARVPHLSVARPSPCGPLGHAKVARRPEAEDAAPEDVPV